MDPISPQNSLNFVITGKSNCSIQCAIHMSNTIQPLTVTVFQPYEHYRQEAIDASTQAGVSQYNDLQFLDDFKGSKHGSDYIHDQICLHKG